MIKLIKSSFYNEELTKEALCKFISNAEYLSMDEQCRSFETEFSAWQEREFSVLFNSGSSANLALIQALLNIGSLKKGDNCGFSGITWATNVMPLIQLGLNAIPIDISMRTLNISLEEVQKIHENSNLKCLFVTNLL